MCIRQVLGACGATTKTVENRLTAATKQRVPLPTDRSTCVAALIVKGHSHNHRRSGQKGTVYHRDLQLVIATSDYNNSDAEAANWKQLSRRGSEPVEQKPGANPRTDPGIAPAAEPVGEPVPCGVVFGVGVEADRAEVFGERGWDFAVLVPHGVVACDAVGPANYLVVESGGSVRWNGRLLRRIQLQHLVEFAVGNPHASGGEYVRRCAAGVHVYEVRNVKGHRFEGPRRQIISVMIFSTA